MYLQAGRDFTYLFCGPHRLCVLTATSHRTVVAESGEVSGLPSSTMRRGTSGRRETAQDLRTWRERLKEKESEYHVGSANQIRCNPRSCLFGTCLALSHRARVFASFLRKTPFACYPDCASHIADVQLQLRAVCSSRRAELR